MSDKIDKWVEKNPESWAKLATNTKQKETFDSFKKKLKIGAKANGKYNAIKHMTNEQIKQIYLASGHADTKTGSGLNIKEPAFKTKQVTVKRKGKTYTRTTNGRWEKHTNFAIKIASQTKPRTKEYNQQVKNIMKATGRTRQAVIKKIQRARK